ncbi:MAG TPA: recombinase XerC, partial [Ruminococcaceae bacterium]|nr:recombinase XerC [Oscillospiraceae bacterium]
MDKKESLPGLPKEMKNFLVYLSVIKGKSNGTVQEYAHDLRTFFRFMKQLRGAVPTNMPFNKILIEDIDESFLASITLSDLYEYLYYITKERKNGAAARARKVSSLRTFFKYLCTRAEVLKEDPTQNLEAPKQRKSLPKYLTLEESMKFLSGIKGPNAKRDFCILTLFLNCGMRLAELVGLNLSDIHGSTMRVTG